MKKFQFFAFSTLFLLVLSVSVFSQKIKPEEILAKHLDSIGTSAIRAANKNRIIVGDADIRFITPKNIPVVGRLVLASAGGKNFWGVVSNSINYPSEKFSFDGKTPKVSFVKDGRRSVLGNFVVSNDIVLEESLLCGTLSTSWALLNMEGKKVKLTSEGTKKIDGKEVYAIGYGAKSDFDITLYFDKETFRHVRTEYKRISSATIGVNPAQSSRFNETRLKVTEDFSDFKTEKGLTLPHTYRLNYSTFGQNSTTEIQWYFVLNEFAFNQNLADGTFDADAH